MTEEPKIQSLGFGRIVEGATDAELIHVILDRLGVPRSQRSGLLTPPPIDVQFREKPRDG